MLVEKEWEITHSDGDESLLKGKDGFIYTDDIKKKDERVHLRILPHIYELVLNHRKIM